MAMDFWEAQRHARLMTTIYLTIFVVLTVGLAIVAELSMRFFAHDSYNTNYPLVGMIFAAVTFAVAFYEYSMYQSFGGSYVAESVGGRFVDPRSTNPKDRLILNVVQEMSLAAALPTPPIYILPVQAINAFAAGLTPTNAAIAITDGALNTLSREELQGVIAHEFGHIHNGDMRISMRLAAMVMGFFFLIYIALRVLQFSPRDRDRKGGNPIMIAALIILAAGALSWLCGSILKASVSRQREYLADASAVQFTRNPNGIANALRKIAKESTHKMPKSGIAYSHLYFDDETVWSSIFATHPPLKKRIEAIEGGKFLPENWDQPSKNT